MTDGEMTDESREDDVRVLFSIGPDHVDPNEGLDTYIHDETVEFRFLIVLLIFGVLVSLILLLELVFWPAIRSLGH